jgi:hypothetical protein
MPGVSAGTPGVVASLRRPAPPAGGPGAPMSSGCFTPVPQRIPFVGIVVDVGLDVG